MKFTASHYWFFVFTLSLSIALLEEAHSHARLDTVAENGVLIPRTTDNNKLKGAPCASQTKATTAPVTLTGGDTITIYWREAINHPGHFIFNLSTDGDTTFSLLDADIDKIDDDQNKTDDLPHLYSADFQIPDIDCTNCTIQFIQVMTENPEFPTFYYNCADVKIVKSAEGGPPTAPPPPPPAPPEGPPDNDLRSIDGEDCLL